MKQALWCEISLNYTFFSLVLKSHHLKEKNLQIEVALLKEEVKEQELVVESLQKKMTNKKKEVETRFEIKEENYLTKITKLLQKMRL